MARNVQEHLVGAVPEPEPKAPSQSAPKTKVGQKEAEKDSVFISHAEKEKEKVSLKEVPLPWFDAARYLRELKPYINRLDGPRWSAFSMSGRPS